MSAGFIINVATLTMASIAMIVCSGILLRLACAYRPRVQRDERVSLIHCANTYIMLFGYVLSVFWLNIATLLGDLNIATLDNSGLSWLCTLRFFFIVIFSFGIYYSFCLQAFFRLARIVYARLAWLQTVRFSLLSILAQWVFAALITIFPLTRTVYQPADHICLAPFIDLLFLIYGTFTAYCVPISVIFLIYLRIVRYMKQTPATLHRHASQRDMVVVRRICLLVSGLLVFALPTFVFWIMFLATGNLYPLSYRLEFFTTSFVLVLLSGTTLLITPQLRTILWNKQERNQVVRFVTTVNDDTRRF